MVNYIIENWFVLLLLFTGAFFTVYLKFPQFRFLKHGIRVLRGEFDAPGNKGDTSHFQAFATAMSGTVGTGNIAGVAYAIYLGGPAALFWMLVTAFLGMSTKFVEVTLSHKYRSFSEDGSVSGGPMYFMRERLPSFRLFHKFKIGKVGVVLAVLFALCTIVSSFGTGSFPQIKSIADAMQAGFGIAPWITGGVLAIFLGLVIIGGIKRIAGVTSKLVPIMAVSYLLGAIVVLMFNASEIAPAFRSIFVNVFTGTSVVGGFLGASISFAFNQGVNRGLFSNEAGQGSAPIAHASAKADEPVSEGMVSMLEPLVDTIVICMITGMVILTSGVWKEKHQNLFQSSDIYFVDQILNQNKPEDLNIAKRIIDGDADVYLFNGSLEIENGILQTGQTIIHARSLAEDVKFYLNEKPYTGLIKVKDGTLDTGTEVILKGNSLIHSSPLTAEAFTRSWFGDWGRYIVTFGILLFAFSTAISWSYYGDRAVTFLWGSKYVIYYQVLYVVGFFFSSFLDTSFIWDIAVVTAMLMALPNLIGILLLHKEAKETIYSYWKSIRG